MPKTKPIKAAHRAALVERIEHALTTGLTHPGSGDGPVALPLPMFSNSTMPDEMARHFAEDAGLPHANVAKLVAEALADVVLKNGGEAAAAAVRQAAKARTPKAPAPAPEPAPAPPRPAATPTGPQPTSGLPTGSITATVNGETVMTDLSDLQKFSADVQPGSQPPFWKKILIMAALEGVTRKAFRRIDITTEDDGGFTVQASTATHAADDS